MSKVVLVIRPAMSNIDLSVSERVDGVYGPFTEEEADQFVLDFEESQGTNFEFIIMSLSPSMGQVLR